MTMAFQIMSKGHPSSSFVLFTLFSLLFTLVNAELTGTIESCSGWSLNRLPELRSFLKDGEAEFYRGVTVSYIPGRQAVLTIYESDNGTDDMVIREKVTLSDIPTKEEMHQLMKDKGFVLKDEKELQRIAEEKTILQELDDYHTYQRSMYYRDQRMLIEQFKAAVIHGPNMPAQIEKQKQSRQGREPDFLVDHYDKMHADEMAIARAKFDPEKALADYRARQAQSMHRYVQKKVDNLKKEAAKQDREEL